MGMVITVTVKVKVVVVVFAYLAIPATTSALFSSRRGTRILIAPAATTTASLGGLLFAYFFDFSIGPAIALFLGGVLVMAALLSKFSRFRTLDMVG